MKIRGVTLSCYLGLFYHRNISLPVCTLYSVLLEESCVTVSGPNGNQIPPRVNKKKNDVNLRNKRGSWWGKCGTLPCFIHIALLRQSLTPAPQSLLFFSQSLTAPGFNIRSWGKHNQCGPSFKLYYTLHSSSAEKRGKVIEGEGGWMSADWTPVFSALPVHSKHICFTYMNNYSYFCCAFTHRQPHPLLN